MSAATIPTSGKHPVTDRGRLNLRAAMLVALAVFAQESVWNFYDAQVPASIAQYTTSAALIGLLMGLDNVLGIVLQPLIGHLSDRTRSRWGRRVPYLVIGAPIAAVFFVLIPFTSSFGSLIICLFLFGLTANSFKSAVDSLTPDFQPAGKRSTANAIAKVATSITIVVSSLISLLIVDRSVQLAFAIPALMMVCATIIVALTIKETSSPGYQRAIAEDDAEIASTPWTFRAVIGDLMRDRSRVMMLVTIFATAGTWAAMRSQLTPYAMDVLSLTRGQAGSLALPAGLAFIVVAVPIALWSDRFGRRKVTGIGTIVFALGCMLAFTVPTVPVTMVGVIIASIGYAAFSINGVVIMWNLAPSATVVGTYTGLYAIATALGASLGPAIIGVMVDLTSWRFLFLHATILVAVAFLCLLGVRREINPRQFDDVDTRPADDAGTPRKES
ncbi:MULTISPECIES: MFS transporter [unclassified Isoptericola]|uniref:MFS transporter n=1 Tax=Isoptericola sp. NPDC057191 TaxID=3346041 RepID=UPI00363AC108